MPRSGYRFLPNVALADVAFLARGSTLDSFFEASARALTEVMVDRRTLRGSVQREVKVLGKDLDRLLYDFLTELIIMKDVDSLLFKDFRVKVDPRRKTLTAALRGEEIDRGRHALRNDVKAVTLHMFKVKRTRSGWEGTVVLDI